MEGPPEDDGFLVSLLCCSGRVVQLSKTVPVRNSAPKCLVLKFIKVIYKIFSVSSQCNCFLECIYISACLHIRDVLIYSKFLTWVLGFF